MIKLKDKDCQTRLKCYDQLHAVNTNFTFSTKAQKV